jgi:hypothetical protein
MKEKQEIKYPTGVDLLEVGFIFCTLTRENLIIIFPLQRTIAAAEGGFATETPAADAWNLVFPDDAQDEEDARDLQSDRKFTFLVRRILLSVTNYLFISL